MRALLRPLAFAVGGAIPITVLLSLILINQPMSVLPYIIQGAGIGIICWLGVMLGLALWKYRQGRTFSNTYRLLLIAGLLLIYTLLGVIDQIIRTKNLTLAENIVPFAIVGASLLHGLVVGFNQRPSAVLGAFNTLWVSVVLGASFGIGAGIIFLTMPQPSCTPGIHCFSLPPLLSLVIGFLLIMVVSFGVGLANTGAAGVGLLLCPIRQPQQVSHTNE